MEGLDPPKLQPQNPDQENKMKNMVKNSKTEITTRPNMGQPQLMMFMWYQNRTIWYPTLKALYLILRLLMN